MSVSLHKPYRRTPVTVTRWVQDQPTAELERLRDEVNRWERAPFAPESEKDIFFRTGEAVWSELRARERVTHSMFIARWFDTSMVTAVDLAFGRVLAANAREPYNHDAYARAERYAKAYVLLLCRGQQSLADRVCQSWFESMEPMNHYVDNYAREMVSEAGLIPCDDNTCAACGAGEL